MFGFISIDLAPDSGELALALMLVLCLGLSQMLLKEGTQLTEMIGSFEGIVKRTDFHWIFDDFLHPEDQKHLFLFHSPKISALLFIIGVWNHLLRRPIRKWLLSLGKVFEVEVLPFDGI